MQPWLRAVGLAQPWVRALALCLGAAVASNASGQPVVSGELALAGPVVVPHRADQHSPAIAHGSGGYLAVWIDQRTSGAASLYAAKLSTAAAVEGLPGRPLYTAPGQRGRPAIAYGEGVFLVVWEEGTGSAADVLGLLVSPDGVPLGATPLGLGTTASVSEGNIGVAFGGGTFLVVWEDDGDAIHGTRVSPTGVVSSPGGVELAGMTLLGATPHRPGVAWNGSHFLVVYEMSTSFISSAIQGRFLQPNGNPVGSFDEIVGRFDGLPALAAIGSSFVLIWESGGDLYKVTVSGSGANSGPQPLTTAPGDQTRPAVAAASASSYFSVWHDLGGGPSGQLAGVRLSAGALTLGANAALGAAASYRPAVACDGAGGCVTLWSAQGGGGDLDVFAKRVDPETGGYAREPVTLAKGPAAHVEVTVGQVNNAYLAVWVDTRDHRDGSLYASVIPGALPAQASAGAALVATAAAERAPFLASSGSGHLLVWESRTGATSAIEGLRLSAEAQAVGGALSIGGGAEPGDSPVAAAGQGGWLVVWRGASSTGGVLRGAQVTWAGEVQPLTSLGDAAAQRARPAIASGGNDYLVAFESRANTTEVAALRLDGSGVPIGSELALSPGRDGQQRPRVAYGEGTYLVAWLDGVALAVTRIDSSGAATPVPVTAPAAEPPAVAFDGQSFLIAYGATATAGGRELRLVRVAPDGTVIDPISQVVGAAQEGELAPALSANGGSSLVAYHQPATPDPSDPAWLRGRLITGLGVVPPPGGPPEGLPCDPTSDPSCRFSVKGWGCGCQSNPGASLVALPLLLLAGWGRRRFRGRRLVLCLGALFLLAIGQPAWARPPTSTQQLQAAERAFERTDYARAAATFEKALSLRLPPEQLARAYEGLGISAAAIGDASRATAAFEKLLRLVPTWQPPAFAGPKVRAPYEAARALAAPPVPAEDVRGPKDALGAEPAGNAGAVVARAPEANVTAEAPAREPEALPNPSTPKREPLPVPVGQAPPRRRLLPLHLSVTTFASLPSSAIGGELGVGMNLTPWVDVQVGLLLGRYLGAQLNVLIHPPVALFDLLTPYLLVRASGSALPERVVPGAGAGAGTYVKIAGGRLSLAVALEGYDAPSHYQPVSTVLLGGYQLDL